MKEFAVIVVIVLVVFGGLLALSGAIANNSCNISASLNPQYEFRYEYWGKGCYIKYNGVWIPYYNLRGVNP